jgi:hypothetical protein
VPHIIQTSFTQLDGAKSSRAVRCRPRSEWPDTIGMRNRKRAGLCLLSLRTVASAFAAACGPIPALPDTKRRTQYTASGSTWPFNIGFQIYGDGTDTSTANIGNNKGPGGL